MYPGVELRLYRYVVVLAEELNFTRAALRLHVAQPSLSKQVRELEDYLGAQLFERSKREVRLTAAGEAFAAEARLTLFHAERAVEGARAAKGQHKGPWSLGYSPLIDLRILSKVRRHLSLAHPAADVRLVSAYTSEQADGLMRGRLQAGLVILPVREQGLTCEGLYREALVLALPERHPLAAKSDIEITDLHELPLVIIRGDIEPRFGEDLNRIFGVARIRPRIFHEATTHAEALELVSEGTTAALTIPSAQYPVRDRIVFRRFVDEFLTAQTGLAYLGENGSAILSSLRKFLFETFQPLDSNAAVRLRDGRARQMVLF
jgi:DNA-binding transcriptional LysR family regulator